MYTMNVYANTWKRDIHLVLPAHIYVTRASIFQKAMTQSGQNSRPVETEPLCVKSYIVVFKKTFDADVTLNLEKHRFYFWERDIYKKPLFQPNYFCSLLKAHI